MFLDIVVGGPDGDEVEDALPDRSVEETKADGGDPAVAAGLNVSEGV